MRYVRPGIAVFSVALLASLCVHLPVYEVLGVLAGQFRQTSTARRDNVVEFELAALGDDPALAPDVEKVAPAADSLPPSLVPPTEPEPEREPEVARKPDEAKPEPALDLPAPSQLELVPPEVANKHAITQESDEPNVEPPPDARFVAEESRRVLEETIASVRNEQRDEVPEAGAGERADPAEAEGNAAETEVADLQNVDGEDTRMPDAQEASERPVEASAPSAGSRDAKAVTVTSAPPTPTPSERVAREVTSGAREAGGEPEEIVIDDGIGRFRIRESPAGAGAGDAGGAQPLGAPSRALDNRAGARAREGLNLDLSWSQFENTFGAEQLRADRQTYLAQRRSTSRGRSRQANWKKFRAAIENHVPYVKSGNQTALNAAASPFANYLAVIHRRIHREFAYEFLRNLPIAGGPFGDLDLHTKLEIVINGDGSLHHVGVAKSSGFTPFDYGAFNAVTDAAPYPAPPRGILSGDGRVYVHWGFYRNERACGTFNATPYILPSPPGTPRPGQHGPLRDEPPAGGGQGLPPDGEFGRVGPGAVRARLALRPR